MSIGTRIGDCVFKTLGTMNTKVIARKCGEIGEQTAKLANEKGVVSADEFQSILNNTLGKRSKKIMLSPDKESYIAEYQRRAHISKEHAELSYEGSISAILPTQYNESTLLNLRLNELSREEVVNAAAHECEHALYDAFSIREKIERLLMKMPFIDKKITNLRERYGEVLGEKQFLTQQIIIASRPELTEITGLTKLKRQKPVKNKIPKEVEAVFRDALYCANILEPGKDKLNFLMASELRNLFRDEVRAYTAGAKAERVYYGMRGQDNAKLALSSELRANMFKAFELVFNKEAKHARNNWFKSLLGMKPNHTREKQSIEVYKQNIKEINEQQTAAEEFNFWTNAANYAV